MAPRTSVDGLRVVAVLAALVACAAPPPPTTGASIRVHPDYEVVPENALVFRIVASEPLALAPSRVEIVDSSGSPVPGAARKVVWDESVRMATIRPTGLERGREYELRVDGLTNRSGEPIGPVRRRFRVAAPDLEPLVGADIAIVGVPATGGTTPVEVRFGEPIAFDSLDSLTCLVDGRLFPGRWSLAYGDTVARFTPTEPWPPGGAVAISIGAGVTDLAGNAIASRPTGPIGVRR